jgi:hypothetical protein
LKQEKHRVAFIFDFDKTSPFCAKEYMGFGVVCQAALHPFKDFISTGKAE